MEKSLDLGCGLPGVTTRKIRWHHEHQTKSLQQRFTNIRSTR